jgi:hypothetical protein
MREIGHKETRSTSAQLVAGPMLWGNGQIEQRYSRCPAYGLRLHRRGIAMAIVLQRRAKPQ